MDKGTLFIISAPSGAGKTSLVKALTGCLGGLVVSVSHTTREQRPGETHGQHYHFVDQKVFDEMVDNDAFLEHARVFGNSYGTSRHYLTDVLDSGRDVLLEIDWQGARQIRGGYPDSVSIFILPPSLQVLETRLQGRGQDSSDTINRRMQDSVAELSHYPEFDYLLINDDFDRALVELKSILIAARMRTGRQKRVLKTVLQQLLEDQC